MNSTTIADFFAMVDGGVLSFISEGSAAIAGAIAAPFKICLVIYIILWGMALMTGMIQELVMDGLRRVLRITIIGALALNAGTYNTQIAERVYKAPGELANVIMRVDQPTSINAIVDEALYKSDRVAVEFKNQASGWSPIDGLGWYITALAVWLSTGFVSSFGAAMILLSKTATGVLLAVGPWFIFALMFNATKRWCESWVGQVLNFSFIYVVIACIISLMFHYWTATLDTALANAANGWTGFIPAFVIGIIMFITMCFVGLLCSGLFGGVSINTLGAFGLAGRSISHAAGSTRPHRIQQSMGRLRQDGRAVAAPVRALSRVIRRP